MCVTMGEVRQCAAICSCIILVSTGFSLLMVWLTAHRHRPEFYLTDFSISNATSRHRRQHSSGLANLPVRFAVAGHNPNNKIGIYCREMTASVFYGNQLVASGLVTQPSFYLAAKKADKTIQGELNATGPAATDPAWAWFADDVVSVGSVALRLLLETRLRFKWYPGMHHHTVECDFRLGEDGNGTLLDLQQQDKYSMCGTTMRSGPRSTS